jgi:hypothetical protein
MANSVLLTKGHFAQLIGVTPARVSQYVADGLLDADALVGSGRAAMVVVEVAKRQLRERRDPIQALGNGLKTRLDPEPATPAGDSIDAQVTIFMLGETMIATLREAFDLPEADGRRVVLACFEQASALATIWEQENGGADARH